ncbi:Fatty acid hydroxylase superfamily protein [Stanieria sp. NIES-3757]|nr:Fatty acid hydroxylase superfamily protein [Stanieria sp. NIES-3757]
MISDNFKLTVICFILTIIFASFLEYWLHRLMHIFPWFGKVTSHYTHHYNNRGAGVIWEFKNYCTVVLILCLTFLISQSVGIRVVFSGIVYAAFSAYAHQLQHDNPTKCFWMKMPVHYIHHKHNQWHHNFGLGVDWWDVIFGTYKKVEWPTEEELNQTKRGLLQIKWW